MLCTCIYFVVAYTECRRMYCVVLHTWYRCMCCMLGVGAGIACRVWLYVNLVEEKALGVCWVWQNIWSAYGRRTKVEAKDKYQHFISVLLRI